MATRHFRTQIAVRTERQAPSSGSSSPPIATSLLSRRLTTRKYSQAPKQDLLPDLGSWARGDSHGAGMILKPLRLVLPRTIGIGALCLELALHRRMLYEAVCAAIDPARAGGRCQPLGHKAYNIVSASSTDGDTVPFRE